ncbi:MAG TPA: ABC transporter permease [Opitutaceae bacterium]|jgi:predicted permease
MPTFIQAARRLRKHWAFFLPALVTLIACISITVTIFSIVHAVMLKPLPFPQGNRLVAINDSYPGAGVALAGTSITNYYERKGRLSTLSSLSIYQSATYIVKTGAEARRVQGLRVSPEFFQTVGVGPMLGRPFDANQLRWGTDNAVILTAEFWKAYFGSDPHVIGRQMEIDHDPVVVQGVLPPGFTYLSTGGQIFRPFSHSRDDESIAKRHAIVCAMIGRLADGATLAQLRTQLQAMTQAELANDPDAEGLKSAHYQILASGLLASYSRDLAPLLLALQCGALLLLAIGAANVANLQLIRLLARRRELALRRSFGAGRWVLLFEANAEAILLLAVGWGAALFITQQVLPIIHARSTDELLRAADLRISPAVFGASIAVALVFGALFMIPASVLCLRTKIASALQSEGRDGTANRRTQFLRHVFVSGQILLAFVLLAGEAVAALSLRQMIETNPGYSDAGVVTAAVSLPWKGYLEKPAAATRFINRLLDQVRQSPGVAQAAISTGLPFGSLTEQSVSANQSDLDKQLAKPLDYVLGISADYFKALGIVTVEGRELNSDDVAHNRSNCVIDERLAGKLWPDKDALQQHIYLGSSGTESLAYTVVGVVRNVSQSKIIENGNHGSLYVPFGPLEPNVFWLVVRGTNGQPPSLRTLSHAFAASDPEVALDDVQPMTYRTAKGTAEQRWVASLGGIFGLAALLLATGGAFAVLSYIVRQRRTEIGIRMALGATPTDILRHFARIGLGTYLFGAAAGSVGAWYGVQLLRSYLPDCLPASIALLLTVAALLGLPIGIAVAIASRRAATLSPAAALRGD